MSAATVAITDTDVFARAEDLTVLVWRHPHVLVLFEHPTGVWRVAARLHRGALEGLATRQTPETYWGLAPSEILVRLDEWLSARNG